MLRPSGDQVGHQSMARSNVSCRTDSQFAGDGSKKAVNRAASEKVIMVRRNPNG